MTLPLSIIKAISRFKGGRHVARLRAEILLDSALALIAENQAAWEGEEPSVQDEHADLMADNEALLFNARAG